MNQKNHTLKQLFSDTVYYGLTTVVARLLNYLLTPLLTAVLSVEYNGKIATIYALISLLNILFTFGIETTFFRYISSYGLSKTSQSLALLLVIIVSFWLILLISLQNWILAFLHIQDSPQLFYYALAIVTFDALSIIGLAKLRYLRRVRYFVLVKILGVLLNIALVIFFLLGLPYCMQHGYFFSNLDQKLSQLDYVLLANLLASILVLIVLMRTLKIGKKITIANSLFRKFWPYAIPLVIIGLAGVINDTMDRVMLPYFIDGDEKNKYIQNGIYAINYKLAALITIFIQAFRMGAEPFFFRYAKHKQGPELYADMLKYFIIFCLSGFLGVVLFLDLWQYFINAHHNSYFASGLKVIPILLFANIFLGIYYNLSVWYKVTDRTRWGAYLALIGVIITILGNIIFIPQYGYIACAYTTLSCYLCMCVISYLLGTHFYPIPYPLIPIFRYIIIALIIFFLQSYFLGNLAMNFSPIWHPSMLIKIFISLGLLVSFLSYVVYKERFIRSVIKSFFMTKIILN